MRNAFEDDDELICRINVAPLVDVVLVLLVVLMVAATAVFSQIPVQAIAEGAPGESPPVLSVSISRSGGLHVDGEEMSEVDLRVLLRRREQANAIVSADGAVHHLSVVRLMDVLRREGVTNIALRARTPSSNLGCDDCSDDAPE